MGYALGLAFRYLRSKKAAFVSVGTLFAVLGVALGVAALATVMSVTGGFQSQFRDKVLGVNAHVLVLKYSADFREYREVMKVVEAHPGVTGVGPFTINPMMVTHGTKVATGVLLKGVDPALLPRVLDLPKHLVSPKPEARDPSSIELFARLRREGAAPPRGPEPRPPELAPRSPMRDMKEATPPTESAAAAPTASAPTAPTARPDDKRPSLEGLIEPERGYASTLPDEDAELPDDVVPDPCKDAGEVAKLPGAIVGTTLARNLSLKVGDCLQVTSPTIGYAYAGTAVGVPVAKQFRVIAIFEAGFDQYDSKLVYVDLYEAQAFYNAGDSVTGVEMRVRDIDDARDISRALDKKLANGIYHTMDWEELNHGLFTALRIQQIGMSAVLALIIVVAAFTVIATLIMVVLDKKKEIAVLKAMGATDDAILRVFVYQGGIIGLLGTTLGLSIGWGVCKGLLVYGFPLDPKVYFVSRLPVDVQPTQFLVTGALAMGICLTATALPALYAAWMRPADGLRDLS